MIKVKCEVQIYPDDAPPKEKLTVENHWNYNDRVVLTIGDKSIIVVARDLHTALNNATNNNRF